MGVSIENSQIVDSSSVSIKELNDTMLIMLSAILEKLPRTTGNDQSAVSIEAGTLPAVTTVTTVSTLNTLGGRTAAQAYDSITNMGALHLYQNIIVS